MTTLWARLGLDSSPFTRGLASATTAARTAGHRMGEQVGNDFAKGMRRAFGAAALVAGVFSLGREAQEIRNQAAALGVTTQEFAAMEIVAKRLGDTSNVTTEEFLRLTQAVIDAGEVSSSDSLKALASAGDVVADAWRRVKDTLVETIATVAKLYDHLNRLSGVPLIPGLMIGSGIAETWKTGSFKAGFQAAGKKAKETWRDAFRESDLGKKEASIAETAARVETGTLEERLRKRFGLYDPGQEKEASERTDRFQRLANAPRGYGPLGSMGSMGLGVAPGRAVFQTNKILQSELKAILNELQKQTRISETVN